MPSSLSSPADETVGDVRPVPIPETTDVSFAAPESGSILLLLRCLEGCRGVTALSAFPEGGDPDMETARRGVSVTVTRCAICQSG
jgi:hypothetical protein